MKKEFTRKGIHMVLALGFACAAPYTNREVIIYASIGLFLMFALFRGLRLFSRIGYVPRVTFGELFFAIGIALSAHLSFPHIALFQTAMFILAFADPFAALIGIRFGKHTYRILDEKRSLEGTFVCFFVSLCILLIFGVPVLWGLVIALALAVIEAISLRGSDNIFIPVGTIIMLTLVL